MSSIIKGLKSVREQSKGLAKWQSILKSDELRNDMETALSMLDDLKKETRYHEDRATYLSMVKRLLDQPIDIEELSLAHSQFLEHLIGQMSSIAKMQKSGIRRYPKWKKYIAIISRIELMLRAAIKASGGKMRGAAIEYLKWLDSAVTENQSKGRAEWDTGMPGYVPKDWPTEPEGREDDEYHREPRLGTEPTVIRGRKPETVQRQFKSEEGITPNNKEYNEKMTIDTKDEFTINAERKQFDDVNWGAKDIVDIDAESDPEGTVFYIYNHSKPYKDKPPRDPFVFSEEYKKADRTNKRYVYSIKDRRTKDVYRSGLTSLEAAEAELNNLDNPENFTIIATTDVTEPIQEDDEPFKDPKTGKVYITKAMIDNAVKHLATTFDVDPDFVYQSAMLPMIKSGQIVIIPDNMSSKVQEGYQAGTVGGAGLGIKKSPMTKILEKPLMETDSDDRIWDLKQAVKKARQITNAIGYDDALTEIIVGIQQLAEKVDIDPSKLHDVESDIRAAKRALESAVYQLVEVFTDELRALESTRDDMDEGQIYSTGGGAGQAMRKYKAKPAGLGEVNRNSPLRGELSKLKRLEKKTESSILKGITTEDKEFSLYVDGILKKTSSDRSELERYKEQFPNQHAVIRPRESSIPQSSSSGVETSTIEYVLYVNGKPAIRDDRRSYLEQLAQVALANDPETKIEIKKQHA
jgi:hypothetical protein